MQWLMSLKRPIAVLAHLFTAHFGMSMSAWRNSTT